MPGIIRVASEREPRVHRYAVAAVTLLAAVDESGGRRFGAGQFEKVLETVEPNDKNVTQLQKSYDKWEHILSKNLE